MYARSAEVYDALYSFKDYPTEASRLLDLLGPGVRTLLDVACGTGKHLEALRPHLDEVAGLELSPEMVAVARGRLPGVAIREGDMVRFDLGRTFDAVVCLFSSIGYVATVERLGETLQSFAGHVRPGGIVAVEPWLDPAVYRVGLVDTTAYESPELHVARVATSELRGRLSVFAMHHLVGTPEGVEHFVETHELALFTREEYEGAFRAAGLEVSFNSEGLAGRGLYIGRAVG